MQGLKTQENNKFIKFFALVQKAAEKQNSVFFLDYGDGREFETDALEGEDLAGWLISKDKVSVFEPLWQNNTVSDDWIDSFCWAVWENKDNPTIRFE